MEDALLKFGSYLFHGLNESMAVGQIFVDITKAFDSGDHKILLNRLEDISGNWF